MASGRTARWMIGALLAGLFLCAALPAAASDDASDAELGIVALNVADIARAEAWYSKVFGFTRTFQYPPNVDDPIEIGLAAPGGGAGLILARLNDEPLPEARGRYGRIILNTSKADMLAEKAVANGATGLRRVTIPGDNPPTIIFFNDLDGYEIELYQAAD